MCHNVDIKSRQPSNAKQWEEINGKEMEIDQVEKERRKSNIIVEQ